jgi:hypothetical protein
MAFFGVGFNPAPELSFFRHFLPFFMVFGFFLEILL